MFKDTIHLTLRQARRLVILLVGATVVLVGVAMMVLPGPAIVVIPAGLAILATEFLWARRLLKHIRLQAVEFKNRVLPPTPVLPNMSHQQLERAYAPARSAAEQPRNRS